ncbi:uncharacterized protein LOC132379510 [Hypanus sabinus]|uniref:uncharacterized protein LOC132379510 n=1 Tax=Hypanus sabinus TaxID=79690 RepID=UPI0028C46234|nr:uncharacterized protein LOC132379510 [Hypanus sabinus]
MKTDMEQNEIQRNAQVIKEFTSLHEALKLQEQAIKEIIKTETTKKQTEVDNFVESKSTLMLQLEGLMLYAIEAFKESKPAVFLQTSAQINKRLSEIMLCVIPSSSLAIIPFEGFELNVNHIKEAIDALPSQLCENELKHLCSGDFQMVQNLNIPCEVKKLKANCSEQEPILNRHCASFTSKAHAALVTHNSDSCLCIPRSCAGNFSSSGSKEDFCTDVLPSLQYSPQYTSEDSCSITSTKTATSGHVSEEKSQSTSNDETTSDATDGDSYANTNSSKSNEKSASNLDPASDASCLDYCESVTSSDHCVPYTNSETQAFTSHTLSCTNPCKSDPRTSTIFQGACFKNHECKNTNCTLYIPAGMDLSSNVLNTPIMVENDEANQEFNQCQRKPEMAKTMYFSERTLEIPKGWWKMHNCKLRHSSGDAFSIELSQKGANTSNDKCPLEPENNKYLNDHDSGDLSKDDTSSVISEQVADIDTGISSYYNSSCLSSEGETNEYVAPFYQPCTFTPTGLDQISYTNVESEDLFNGEKSIPLSICINDSLSQSEKSNDSCNMVSYVHPHYTIRNHLSCKDMDLTSEREGSEMITDDCQLCQLSSSAGCKIECSKQGTPCLLVTASHKAEHTCFDNVDMSNHLRYWNTSSILRNIISRCKFGGQPAFRNPKLLSKTKTFIQSNPKTQTSGTAQINPSHSSAYFDVNLNMSGRDFIRNKALHFPKTAINNGAKSHSNTHPYSTDFPKRQTFRNVHRDSSQLKPQNGIGITTCQKKQEKACTLEKKVSENRDTKNLPWLLQMQNVALECDAGIFQLSDNHVQFDSENVASAQLYEQLRAPISPMEPMTALTELPGPPEIYKHTVNGTSAKVKWMCPPLGKKTAYFFELQFQEIISIDKEVAIPQDQAGVISGIKHKNFVATNLNSNSEYLFRVRAVTMTGKGPWCQPYKIVTVCGTVENGMDTKAREFH